MPSCYALPYHDANRPVAIWGREIHQKGTSKLFDLYSDYENWKAHSGALEQAAAAPRAPSQPNPSAPISSTYSALLRLRRPRHRKAASRPGLDW